jgi:nucleoside-diphosphate-sugar epimerase
MKALVTGATGLLGSHVALRLLQLGWRVRALVRRPPQATWLAGKGVELVRGDVTDGPSMVRAARGTELVVHAAAAIGAGGDGAPFAEVNVGGTSNAIRAAGTAGARLVLVSSTAVFGRERYRDEPTDEDAPVPELPPEDAYGRSKQRAEALALEAHRAGRVWAAVVRPPMMYGCRDRQLVPRVAPILSRGLFPLVDGGRARLNLVHADAVALGIVAAGTSDRAGGRIFHLTDDFPLPVRDLVRWAGEGLGRRILTPSVPLPAAQAGFGLLSAALTLAGRGDLARHAPGMLATLSRDNPFSSRRAREELGWVPEVRPEAGVPAAFRWWLESTRPLPKAAGGRVAP